MSVTSVYILPEWMIATVDGWGMTIGNRGGKPTRVADPSDEDEYGPGRGRAKNSARPESRLPLQIPPRRF